MAVQVVDASALGALLFGEPEAEKIAETLGSAKLAVPGLLEFELASICLKKIKTYPEQSADILAAFRLLSQMALETVGVDHVAVVTLANTMGLTTYDASYLWLAQALGVSLVTLDRELRRAAERLGVRFTPG
jgi:predicted nucleic acid-binding protein